MGKGCHKGDGPSPTPRLVHLRACLGVSVVSVLRHTERACTWKFAFSVHELLATWWAIPVSRGSFLSYLASEPSAGYILTVREEEVEAQ